MAVTKQITRLEKSNVKLSMTVPRDEVRAKYQDLLKDYVKNVQIPGFRKGKVPQEVLERKFGEALKGEALGRILEAAVSEVFKDETLPRNERPLPYSTPKIDEEPKLDLDQDLTFSVLYDVFPDIQVGQWKGLEVEVPDVVISDEDLNRELEEVRDRNSVVLDRDDGAEARKNDVVTVDYCEIGEDGEPVPDTGRDEFAFTLGSGYNPYEFDDEITGMKKGETKEFSKTFPPDFKETEMAGQTKKLRVTLTALKEKKLPDLDDELAQDVDEKYGTLEDLKNDIRKRLQKTLDDRLQEIKIDNLLKKIMETSPVILPESMIRTEVESRLRSMAQRLGTSIEAIMRIFEIQGEDDLNNPEGKWRPAAEKALHSRLIVETLMNEQTVETSDEELENEFGTLAADSDTSVEEVKESYQEEYMRAYLKESIRERKLFDILLAENTIKTGAKENYVDLMAQKR